MNSFDVFLIGVASPSCSKPLMDHIYLNSKAVGGTQLRKGLRPPSALGNKHFGGRIYNANGHRWGKQKTLLIEYSTRPGGITVCKKAVYKKWQDRPEDTGLAGKHGLCAALKKKAKRLNTSKTFLYI